MDENLDQAESGAMGSSDKFDEELGVEFVRRCREESAKRILELKVRNQLPAKSAWLEGTMAFVGINAYQNQYYETIGGEPRPKPRPEYFWERFVRYFYYYCLLKTLVYLLFQYNYDYYKLEYESQQALFTSSSNIVDAAAAATTSPVSMMTNDSSSFEEAEQVGQKKRLARSLVKLLGSPYMEFSYIVEALYMVAIWTSLAAYLGPYLYVSKHGLNFSITALLVDREREQIHQDNIMLYELSNFLTSSRQYVRTKFNFKSSDWAPTSGRRLGGSSWVQEHADDLQESIEAIRGHKQALEELKRMALAGHLQPISRSPKLILKMSKWYYGIGQNTTCAMLIMTGIPLVWPFLSHSSTQEPQTGPMDLLALVEIVFIVIIGHASAAFYLPLIVMGCIDNIALVAGLRHEVSRCIASSMVEETSSCRCQRQRHADRTNAQVLSVFIHYKIFVSQLKKFQHVYGFVAQVMILVLTSVTLTFLGHARRLDLRYLTMNYMVAGVIAMALAGELCLAPVCYLHARCKQLYQSFHSIVAHLVQMRHQSTVADHRYPSNINNPHLMALFRKELSESQLRLSQFAPVTLGYSLTYANFLKFHFWLGLLLTSLFISSDEENGLDWSLVPFL